MNYLLVFLIISAISCIVHGSPVALYQANKAKFNAIVTQLDEKAEEESLITDCAKCLVGGLNACVGCKPTCVYKPSDCPVGPRHRCYFSLDVKLSVKRM